MVEQSLPATHEQSRVGVGGSGHNTSGPSPELPFSPVRPEKARLGGEKTLGTTRQVAEVVIKVRRPKKMIREALRHHEAQWCLCRGDRMWQREEDLETISGGLEQGQVLEEHKESGSTRAGM